MREAGAAARVLVVAPSAREAAALGRGALACGTGERCARAVSDRLRDGRYDVVILAGVCGGLDPSLAPGSLILGRRVVAPDGRDLTPDRALIDAARQALRARGAAFVSSSLLTAARPAASRAEKTALWNAHGAAGVDMETFAIAEAAESCGVRWLAVRAVVDPAPSGLPASLREWDGEDEREVARAALRRPAEWPAYALLALRMRAALRSLRAAMPVVTAATAEAAARAQEIVVPLVNAR